MTSEYRKQALLNELHRRERRIRCEIARRDFYEYCKLTAPDFYTPERKYLKILCQTLQKLYEGKLKLPSGKIAIRLMLALPPRFGKTRTLIKFTAWILGRNHLHKTITAAYNDTLAFDFSKFTRDEIKEEKISPGFIVYSDIFPNTRVKRGSSAMKQWAVEGSHFSYRGAGLGGTITGKGGNLLIIDDPVKDAETAFNEAALDKIWLWYTGTWLSRKESGALEIITHTPWPCKDISARIMNSEMADSWYLISMPAIQDKEKKKMLCSSILSFDQYQILKKSMDPLVFAANYDMIRLDKKGMMYEKFKTYIDLPRDQDGKELFQERLMVADTAGKGEDYFCSLYGPVYNGFFYVIDVDYTQEDIDVTEERTASKLIGHKITTAYIENNTAGHSFVYHVEKILNEKYQWFGTMMIEFAQTKNKEGRIFSHRIDVMNRIIFPVDWRIRWPDFYNAVTTYSKIGKNVHDDAPDALTIAAEYLNGQILQNKGIGHSVV